METVRDFIFGGSKITADGDYSHEIKRHLLLGRKAMTNLAYQAPPSMGFSRQEYRGGLPFPSLGDLPGPGIEPRSPSLQVDSLLSEPPGKPKNTGVGSLSLLQWIFPIQ